MGDAKRDGAARGDVVLGAASDRGSLHSFRDLASNMNGGHVVKATPIRMILIGVGCGGSGGGLPTTRHRRKFPDCTHHVEVPPDPRADMISRHSIPKGQDHACTCGLHK